MKNENIQKTKLCIQTYINLYGTMPELREMVDWTGLTYNEVYRIYQAEQLLPKAGTLAA